MKIIITLIAIVLTMGTLAAQASKQDYKSRNHKLNKSYNSENGQIIATVENDIKTNVNDYRNRNAKFHKTVREDALVIPKSETPTEYKARNHKLNKYYKVGSEQIISISENDIKTNVNFYLERNAYFHKASQYRALATLKIKIKVY